MRSFVRAHYRDIPSASRGALGQGVLDLFANEEPQRANERPEHNARKTAPNVAAASTAGSAAAGAQSSNIAAAAAAPSAASSRERERPPRITWKSFHRVCAALGLHLNERRGQASIRKLASEEAPVAAAFSSSSSAAAAAGLPGGGSFDPGMSFDDFLVFYSGLSKGLSVTQELREVWRLLDEDLDGLVPLSHLRAAMLGLERVSPTNTSDRCASFYDSNYKYHYSEADKRLTSEQLVDQSIASYFCSPTMRKDVLTDKINFEEFVNFMYA